MSTDQKCAGSLSAKAAFFFGGGRLPDSVHRYLQVLTATAEAITCCFAGVRPIA